jgi:hypothetical protein
MGPQHGNPHALQAGPRQTRRIIRPVRIGIARGRIGSSIPTIAPSITATSRTLRAMGPARVLTVADRHDMGG